MSYTGSNLCYPSATLLPVCSTCTGEGVTYCFVKKDCPLCDGKQSVCGECGGCGYIREMDIKRCEECQGIGRAFRRTLTPSTTSP